MKNGPFATRLGFALALLVAQADRLAAWLR